MMDIRDSHVSAPIYVFYNVGMRAVFVHTGAVMVAIGARFWTFSLWASKDGHDQRQGA